MRYPQFLHEVLLCDLLLLVLVEEVSSNKCGQC